MTSRLDALSQALDLLAEYILDEKGYACLRMSPSIDLPKLRHLLTIAKGTRSMKKPSKMQAKVGKVMGEFKSGSLHSGSKKGSEVTSRKQAIAIAMSEGRKAAHRGKR
jgi:hypothetical protein